MMLTNAFYFKLYRPYMFDIRDQHNRIVRRARIAEKTPQYVKDQGMTFILNKALKDEIVNYAQNVSHNVTGLNIAVRSLMRDMRNFEDTAEEYGHEAAIQQIEYRLDRLTEAFNQNANFMEYQQHSAQLRNFSYELSNNVYHNRERLGRVGFYFSEEEEVRFNPDSLRLLHDDEIKTAFDESLQVFSVLYRNTGDILSAPLSEHMQFKGLSYHYNYRLGKIVEDGFGMIQSGMLLDVTF